MKETKKSLKFYFIIVGFLGLYNITSVSVIKTNIILGILCIMSVILSVVFLYLGVRLNTLIISSSKLIINFLYVMIVYIILVTIFLAIFVAVQTIAIASSAINALILIYLIKNIKRIILEETQQLTH